MSGPVVGTDGVVPIYQPEARWCFWSINEVYTGSVGNNKYIPKVNDYVIDPTAYVTYIVDFLDPITLIPTLREIRPANMSYSLTETDVLFGVGPGTQADTYRVYLDKTVVPHVLAVDVRLKIAGTMSSYAKIFKGSGLSENDHVISKMYDSNGNFISENVPLELVAIDSHVNYSIKMVSVCNTVEDLLDGEVVTVVIYNDAGHVVSKRQLLVENTTFIRSINSSQKYITSISLSCPFMSPTLDHVIDFPLNIPTNALNLMGTVQYSDGSSLTLPVNGTKFKIFGLDQYVSTIIGQKIDLVLSYQLSPGELSYSNNSTVNFTITEPYSLVTINPNNSYTVKLFGYPFWIDDINGYQMRWWLLNLDRNVYFEVTPYVQFAENTGAFNPKGYGYLQRKAVSVNLRDVSGSFKPFVHTQLVDITLNAPPTTDNTPWLMSHEVVGSRPAYGVGLFAKKMNATTIRVNSAFTDLVTWKENLYLNTFPLINPSTELNPMAPTHFVVTYGTTSTEYGIADWNSDLNLGTAVSIYKTVTLRFIKRSASGDMQLSIAALIIKP